MSCKFCYFRFQTVLVVEDVVEDVASVEEIEAEVVVELHAVQRGSVEEIVAEAEVVFVEETVGVL